MMTVRQIEKLWNTKGYTRLLGDLLSGRPEASARLETELLGALPVAALAIIRLDELSQSHVCLCDKLLRTLLAAQESDGGWGDPAVTALCLRALSCDGGAGLAIERGLVYLANLQKSDGIWPNIPIRRLPADPFVSAYILFTLGDHPDFRAGVRFDQAVAWFESHESALDPETRRLWDRAAHRCRLATAAPAALWS